MAFRSRLLRVRGFEPMGRPQTCDGNRDVGVTGDDPKLASVLQLRPSARYPAPSALSSAPIAGSAPRPTAEQSDERGATRRNDRLRLTFADYASPPRPHIPAHRLLRVRKPCDRAAWRRRRHDWLLYDGSANYNSLCSRSEHHPVPRAAIGYGSTHAAGPTSCPSLTILADAVRLFRRQHAAQHGILRCGRHR